MTGLSFEAVTCTLGSLGFRFDGVVPAGAITALTGASGSGKSTLINLIAGFETPSSGRVLAGERDLTRLFPGDRPLSLIFQDHNLFAHLTVEANVGLGIDPRLRLSSSDRQRIAAALDRVGLPGFAHRLPASLSGGEKQRAAFARALVRRQPILLADEPFAALDPALRIAMGEMMRDMARATGMTVLFVSHDEAEVLRLADHRLHILHGRIAAAGEPRDVAHRLVSGKAENSRETP